MLLCRSLEGIWAKGIAKEAITIPKTYAEEEFQKASGLKISLRQDNAKFLMGKVNWSETSPRLESDTSSDESVPEMISEGSIFKSV